LSLLRYLRCSEGRRFLSFLFTISAPFIDQLHGAIKNQLPTCRASLLENYGEVYYHLVLKLSMVLCYV
jgi:hypothetical protein